MVNLEELFELHKLACQNVERYPKKRFIYDQIKNDTGKHFVAIVGPRGSGKTIILKQLAAHTSNSFYISVDTLKDKLFDTIKQLHQDFKIKTFFLDEIHFSPNFKECLKKLYDFLPIKVIFTSSISLSLYDSSYDLSRRVLLIKLYPFSFREYLFFKCNFTLTRLTFFDIIEKKWDKKIFEYSQYFNDYLQKGILPFALDETSVLPLLKNIISTVINKDIPLVEKINVEELEILNKLLNFIGKSKIDGINYSSLSKNLGITKYKAAKYVDLFEKAFILHQVMPRGTNVLKEAKITMSLPYRLLYSQYDEVIGAIREDFFVETLRSLNLSFYYLKSTRGEKTPDYLVSIENKDLIIEIGGRGKGRQQFKGINFKKKIIFTHSLDLTDIKRPLFLCGLL